MKEKVVVPKEREVPVRVNPKPSFKFASEAQESVDMDRLLEKVLEEPVSLTLREFLSSSNAQMENDDENDDDDEPRLAQVGHLSVIPPDDDGEDVDMEDGAMKTLSRTSERGGSMKRAKEMSRLWESTMTTTQRSLKSSG